MKHLASYSLASNPLWQEAVVRVAAQFLARRRGCHVTPNLDQGYPPRPPQLPVHATHSLPQSARASMRPVVYRWARCQVQRTCGSGQARSSSGHPYRATSKRRHARDSQGRSHTSGVASKYDKSGCRSNTTKLAGSKLNLVETIVSASLGVSAHVVPPRTHSQKFLHPNAVAASRIAGMSGHD